VSLAQALPWYRALAVGRVRQLSAAGGSFVGRDWRPLWGTRGVRWVVKLVIMRKVDDDGGLWG